MFSGRACVAHLPSRKIQLRMWPAIESNRLTLHSLSIRELEMLLADDRCAVQQLLNCDIPVDYPLNRMPLALRLKQIRTDATVQPWLLRAMIDRESRAMIGHIGFHSPPPLDYLSEIAPDGVELGYTVHPTFRRRGYATEAALALMNWARLQHNQRCFVLSISPQNLPSIAMAKSLGFTQCGSHIDDEDGLEIEFVRRVETWPDEWRAKMVK
jgi:[ribosomal protein S5]-alanine N-acetyltransferase